MYTSSYVDLLNICYIAFVKAGFGSPSPLRLVMPCTSTQV